MAAPSETYVDPSIAADSGSGTIGDPYGDLQYALNTMTRDATNGDRINIKAGTDEVLSAALTLTTYGTPTRNEPLIFQGYTSAAGDGGIGGIDGNASVTMFASTSYDFVSLIDLKLHNTGSNNVVHLDSHIKVLGCEIYDGAIGVWMDDNSLVHNCNFHDLTIGVFVDPGTDAEVSYCYFKNGASIKFSSAISANFPCKIYRNTISLDGTSDGIRFNNGNSNGGLIDHNSIFSDGGTGQAIYFNTGRATNGITNNLIEGFSGTGGSGIDGESASGHYVLTGNAVYNCLTEYANLGDALDWPADQDNESLGSSPFAKSGSDTFANRAAYFEPNDVGNVRGGAFPTALRLDKGAVQHTDPAGGNSDQIFIVRKGIRL